MTGNLRKRKADKENDENSSNVKSDPLSNNPGSSIHRRFIIWIIILSIGVGITLYLVDTLVDNNNNPEAFSLSVAPEFVGALAQNQLLVGAQRMYEGQLRGPESIVVKNGELFTGTGDGKILRIKDDTISIVTQLGELPCGAWEDEPTCGRPLGMRFDAQGYLIVADAYLGLFKVDVTSGVSEKLYCSSQEINGKRSRFLNDLDIADDGSIYVSDSSTKWDRRNNRMAIYEGSSDGRLLKYDPKTKTMTELLSGFYFLNGVQLSPNQDFLLLTETTRCRIFKYHLKGSKAGEKEIFLDNLPGLPDNIRPSSGGGYWASIAIARLPGLEWRGYDLLASLPTVRRLLTKILSPEQLVRLLGRPYGLLLELNQQGEIVRSLHDPQGETIPAVSEVEDIQGVLYLGSYFSPFIGKLDMTES